MLLRTRFLALALLLLGCDEADNLLAPVPEASERPPLVASAFAADATSASILSGSTAADLLDGSFSFLPPLPVAPTTGEFDDGLLNDLTVEICAPASCGTSLVTSFSAAGSVSREVLKLDPVAEQYQVNWNTGNHDLSASKLYRIRVLVLGLEIGHADVEMVSTGKELKDLATGSTIGLVDGRTLPVKFRVDRNPLVDAWRLAGAGASADEVAAMLETAWSADVAAVIELLALAAYPAEDVAGVLRTRYGQDAAQSLAWLLGASLVTGASDAFDALAGAGHATADVLAALIAEFALTAADVAALLAGAGHSIGQIADMLTDLFGSTPAEIAGILSDAESPAAVVGDWLLVEIGGSSPDPVVEVASILDQAGYSFEDVAAWVGDNTASSGAAAAVLNDAGYGADVVIVYLEVTVGLAIEQTVADLAGAGYTEAEVIEAATSKTTATLETIVEAMVASFGTAAERMAELLEVSDVAGGAAASAVMGAYDFTLEQTLSAFRLSTFAVGELAEFAWETIGDVPGRLGVTMNALRLGLGASFDNVKDWAWDKAADTAEMLEAAGLSGYSSAEIVGFLYHVAGASADQIMDMGARYGMAAADVIAAMATQTTALIDEIAAAAAAAYDLTAAEIAGLLDQAGYTVEQIYGAVAAAFDLTVQETITALRDLGLAVGEVADWALGELSKTTTDAVAVLAAIMAANNYAHEAVMDMVFESIGFVTRAFEIFHDLSFDAGTAARRAMDAGGDFMDVFNAVQAEYALSLEEAADLLKGAGIPVDEIGAWLMARLEAQTSQTVEGAAAILKSIGFGADVVGGFIADQFEGSAELTAQVMKTIGYTAGDVADFLYRVDRKARGVVASALEFAGYSAVEAIIALKQFTQATALEATQFMRDTWGVSKDVAAGVLNAAAYPLTDIVGALLGAFTWGIGELEALLVSIGFLLADVVAVLGA